MSLKCAEKNRDLVNKLLEDLDNEKGSFSQQGMSKLKSKLCQKGLDPPMSKIDSNGQVITSPSLLNVRTYKRNFQSWTWMKGMKKVLKNIKTNKTRDPLGLIKEIFKPGCMLHC